MEEEWKTIPGYDPDFVVSTKGNVFRISKNIEVAQVLTGIPQYKYVNILTESGERVLRRVHNLMGRAFLENPYNLPIVDHIDRDKMNNDLSNLRWVDSSRNQRNTDSSLYIGEVHVLEYVEKYPNPKNAYAYLYRLIQEEGYSWEEAVFKYGEYLERGRDRTTVMWNGEEVYLTDLCNKYGKDREAVIQRLGRGWGVWNALFNCPEKHPFSIEVVSKTDVYYWIPSRKYLQGITGFGEECLITAMSRGECYEDWISYDPLNQYRKTVLGVTGTLPELCEHFNVEMNTVQARIRRHGMSLEEALTKPRDKVKKVFLNGVGMTTKAMYESLGLNQKTVNSWRSKQKVKPTIEETLIRFGVDVSEIDLKY